MWIDLFPDGSSGLSQCLLRHGQICERMLLCWDYTEHLEAGNTDDYRHCHS